MANLTRAEIMDISRKMQDENKMYIRLVTFQELFALGVTAIEVNYSGSGDSGDWSDLTLRFVSDNEEENERIRPEAEAKLENKRSTIWMDSRYRTDGWRYNLRLDEGTIRDIIVRAMIDEVSNSFGGWEIDDGSYGCATIHLKTGLINIEHTWRNISREHFGSVLFDDADLIERKNEIFGFVSEEDDSIEIQHNLELNEMDWSTTIPEDRREEADKKIEEIADLIRARTPQRWASESWPILFITLNRYEETIKCVVEVNSENETYDSAQFYFTDQEEEEEE